MPRMSRRLPRSDTLPLLTDPALPAPHDITPIPEDFSVQSPSTPFEREHQRTRLRTKHRGQRPKKSVSLSLSTALDTPRGSLPESADKAAAEPGVEAQADADRGSVAAEPEDAEPEPAEQWVEAQADADRGSIAAEPGGGEVEGGAAARADMQPYGIEKLADGVFVSNPEAKKDWELRQIMSALPEVDPRSLPLTAAGDQPSVGLSAEEDFDRFYSRIKDRLREYDLSGLSTLSTGKIAKKLAKGAGKGALAAAAGMYLAGAIGIPGIVESTSTLGETVGTAAGHGAAYGLFSEVDITDIFKDPDFKINLLTILCFYLLRDNMMNAVDSVPGERTKKDVLGRKISDIYKFIYDTYSNEKTKGSNFHINFVENISKEIFEMINQYVLKRPHQRGRGKKKTKKKQKKKTKKKQKKKTKKKQKKKTKKKQKKS